MDLKEHVETMKELMQSMCDDLEKLTRGNKTAAQRVRTNSVLFAKVAKHFRKESVALSKETFSSLGLSTKKSAETGP